MDHIFVRSRGNGKGNEGVLSMVVKSTSVSSFVPSLHPFWICMADDFDMIENITSITIATTALTKIPMQH